MRSVAAIMYAHQAGGMEELQTDVMRFMAILAFCLVAIFALVQSIPLAPAKTEAVPVESESVVGPETTPDAALSVAPDPGSPPEAADPLHSGPIFHSQPDLEPLPEPVREVVRPDPQTVTRFAYRGPAPVKSRTVETPVTRSLLMEKMPEPATPVPEPVAKQAPTPAPKRSPERSPETSPALQKGFTLKFASAAALRELVQGKQISFFALTQSQTWQLKTRNGQLVFSSSARPREMHEMLSSTVPGEVINALSRAGVSQSRESVRWGVVLSNHTSQQLQQILRRHDGGALTILRDGAVKLEPAGGNTGSRGGPA